MNRIALMILALPAVTVASDPFGCVDPDIVQAFVIGAMQGEPAFSTSVPDHFVKLDVPMGTQLVGSQTRGAMTIVVYKTDKNADDAISRWTSALIADGWTNMSQKRRSSWRGFQTGNTPRSATLCRDSNGGSLSIKARENSGQTLVSLMQHIGTEPQGCGDPLETLPRHDPTDLMARLPVLNVPKDAKTSNVGLGGDGNEVTSRIDVSDSLGRADFLSYFGDQIRNQDWVAETSWSSSSSSGSVWSQNSPEHGLLIGTLHVFGADSAAVRIRFSINPADPAKGKQHGSWSSQISN